MRSVTPRALVMRPQATAMHLAIIAAVIVVLAALPARAAKGA